MRKKALAGFSGGMRQRFGIAQALIGNPELIIVDEPTAGLDPEERNRFLNLLAEIGENVVVILSTHIVEDVSDLCPRMAVLAGGRIQLEGAPLELIQSTTRADLDEDDRARRARRPTARSTSSSRPACSPAGPSSTSFPTPIRATASTSVEGGLEDVYFSTLAAIAPRGLRSRDMFARIAAFEFRYQLKNPVFWVAAALVLPARLRRSWPATDRRSAAGGNVHENSPYR